MDMDETTLTVKPAYGRNLNSKKEVMEYYNDQKDFQIFGMSSNAGRKINKQDAERFGVFTLRVRYAQSTKIHIINVKDNED